MVRFFSVKITSESATKPVIGGLKHRHCVLKTLVEKCKQNFVLTESHESALRAHFLYHLCSKLIFLPIRIYWVPTHLVSRFCTWSGVLKTRKYSVRFEVFTAVTMKNGVFWNVKPCGSCKNRRFGGTWRLLHQGDKNRWTRNNTSCN
jgi:hypothetical protein